MEQTIEKDGLTWQVCERCGHNFDCLYLSGLCRDCWENHTWIEKYDDYFEAIEAKKKHLYVTCDAKQVNMWQEDGQEILQIVAKA
jgi:hypothetical protein